MATTPEWRSATKLWHDELAGGSYDSAVMKTDRQLCPCVAGRSWRKPPGEHDSPVGLGRVQTVSEAGEVGKAVQVGGVAWVRP